MWPLLTAGSYSIAWVDCHSGGCKSWTRRFLAVFPSTIIISSIIQFCCTPGSSVSINGGAGVDEAAAKFKWQNTISTACTFGINQIWCCKCSCETEINLIWLPSPLFILFLKKSYLPTIKVEMKGSMLVILNKLTAMNVNSSIIL